MSLQGVPGSSKEDEPLYYPGWEVVSLFYYSRLLHHTNLADVKFCEIRRAISVFLQHLQELLGVLGVLVCSGCFDPTFGDLQCWAPDQ